MNRLKEITINSSLLIGSTAVAIGIAYLIFLQLEFVEFNKLNSQQSFVNMYDLNQADMRRLKPNFEDSVYTPWGTKFNVSTNRLGARNVKDVALKEIDRPKIIFYGDSQIFGYGLSGAESIPAITSLLLNGNANFEVINRGISGTGVEETLILLNEDLSTGVAKKGDIVVVSTYLNDITDAMSTAESRVSSLKRVSDLHSENNRSKSEYVTQSFKSAIAKLGSQPTIGFTSLPVPSLGGLPESGITLRIDALQTLLSEASEKGLLEISGGQVVANDNGCFTLMVERERSISESREVCVAEGYSEFTFSPPLNFDNGDIFLIYFPETTVISNSNAYSSTQTYRLGIGPLEGADTFSDGAGNYAIRLSISGASKPVTERVRLAVESAGKAFKTYKKNPDAAQISKGFRAHLSDACSLKTQDPVSFHCIKNIANPDITDVYTNQLASVRDILSENDVRSILVLLPSIFGCLHDANSQSLNGEIVGDIFRFLHLPQFDAILRPRLSDQHCDYFLQDSHFNQKGTSEIAGQLASFLLEEYQ